MHRSDWLGNPQAALFIVVIWGIPSHPENSDVTGTIYKFWQICLNRYTVRTFLICLIICTITKNCIKGSQLTSSNMPWYQLIKTFILIFTVCWHYKFWLIILKKCIFVKCPQRFGNSSVNLCLLHDWGHCSLLYTSVQHEADNTPPSSAKIKKVPIHFHCMMFVDSITLPIHYNTK
jgi:hypothetical protein